MADPPSLAPFMMRAKILDTGILSSGAPTWKEKLVHAQYRNCECHSPGWIARSSSKAGDILRSAYSGLILANGEVETS